MCLLEIAIELKVPVVDVLVAFHSRGLIPHGGKCNNHAEQLKMYKAMVEYGSIQDRYADQLEDMPDEVLIPMSKNEARYCKEHPDEYVRYSLTPKGARLVEVL